jgi:hypothetical protein
VPVSLAAVLVLSVVLVVTMRREAVLPALEEPVRQLNSEVVTEAGQPAMKARVTASSPEESVKPAQPAATLSETNPAMSSRNEDVAAKPAPAAGFAAPPPPAREDTVVQAFDRLFVGDETAGMTTGAAAQRDVTAAIAPAPASQAGEQRSRAVSKLPLQSPAITEQKSLLGKSGGVQEEQEGRSGPEQISRERQFLAALTGAWSGRLVMTPTGTAAYAITFQPAAKDCITGTAHPGTNHRWTFCLHNDALSLDFLTDFHGNHTPVRFRQVAYKDGIYSFRADRKFMEVLVHADKTNAWIRIFQNGKLQVEIRLTNT